MAHLGDPDSDLLIVKRIRHKFSLHAANDRR